MQVFFGIVMTAMGLGEATQFAPEVSKAKAAVISVFSIIDRKSKIDPSDIGGQVPAKCNGDIEFKDVAFSYPTRSEVKVFEKFNLSLKAGNSYALVGESGGGKSTVIQLLQRFYDPLSGSI